jgi:PAS domain S-box-containing protein
VNPSDTPAAPPPDPARLLDHAFDAMFAWDVNRGVTYWNNAAEALYGFSAAEMLGHLPQALLGTEFPISFDACVAALRDAGRWEGELRQRTKDGRLVVVESRMSVVRTLGGIQVLEVTRDVSASKAAEAALRDHEERVHFALQAARAGTWELDLASDAMTWSPTMYALFGMEPTDRAGTRDQFIARIFEADRDLVLHVFDRAARDGSDLAIEYRVSWPDGSIHWHYMRARVVADRAGRPIRLSGAALDITDRRSLEAQFRQAQKMEAVGQLAGGVAHDFNNLLTAILGYANFLDEEVQDEQQRRDVQEIVKAAKRAALLTKQLLAFSRRQVVETSLVDVNALIGDLTSMLTRLIGEHIAMTTSLSTDAAPVKADRTQLEQVVMNLVVNARDAMPNGGAIRVETANVILDDTYAMAHASARPGPYVLLTVSDTGEGMSEEVKTRIFEPFFTTKGRDKGTGLGLSTVYGIVSQAGGYLWVYSEPGRGTTFKIYLPRVVDAAAAAAEFEMPRRLRGGQETVLLVEDEEPVRMLTRIILERAGYKVLDAPDPAAAIVAFEEAGASVDLLLSDIIMPGGTGPELYRRLSGRQPSLRALMMSGYTGNAAVDRRHFESGAAFLEKPFTAEALTRKVRDVLDR